MIGLVLWRIRLQADRRPAPASAVAQKSDTGSVRGWNRDLVGSRRASSGGV